MKKKCKWEGFPPGSVTKILLRMKLLTFFLFVSMVTATASSYSQQTKFNLKLNGVTVSDVFREIEANSEFILLYNEKQLDTNRKVDVKAENETIDFILNQIFKDTRNKYKIYDRQIVILTDKMDESPSVVNLETSAEQKKEISGTVKDSKGVSLPGVSVVVKGTTTGTITDNDGKFVLALPMDAKTLLFSFVGMKSQEMTLTGKTQISVTMAEETIGIDEVVAIGYGTQKKVNLTGSVDVVSGDKLANRPAANVALMLQGVSPSLNISLSNMGGEPGASQSWQIRGIGSLSGNSAPLILVDGVEMNVNLLDPESVESVSILKDASASAVYGSRAAFGVVLITTKKGKKNQPIQIQYSNNLTIAVPAYVPNMLDSYTYATAFNQSNENAGLVPTFPAEQVERIKGYMAGTYLYPYDPENPPNSHWRGRWNGNANNNWTRMYYKPSSFNQKHNFNLSGSNEKTQYYFNAGYFDQPGIYTWGADSYKRYNILANFSTQVNDWIRFDFSTKYSKTNEDHPLGVVGLPRTYMWQQFIDFWPTMPMYNIDGTLNNPVISAMQEGGRILTEANDLWVNIGAEFEPVKGWKTNVKYNYNSKMGSELKNPKPVITHVANGTTGNIGESTTGAISNLNQGKYMLFSAYSSYEKLIGKHYLKGLIGYEWDKNDYRGLYGSKMDLITPEVVAISAALGAIQLEDQISHWATQGIFGRLNYNFDEKYLLEFSARYDGSSRFAAGSRWGFFPSFSAGYNISKENFWQPLESSVNTLKFRLSYGALGNQNVANYLYLATIPVATNYNPDNYQNSGYIIDDEIPLYAGAPNIISSNLTWETIATFDLGLDAEFLKKRLSLGFDWYNRVTSNMIGPSVQLPSVLGTNAPSSNNAKLSTKGIELSLGWRDRISSNLSYDLKVGFGNYKTTILEYLNETGSLDTWYAGRVYGDIWGLTTDGIIQAEGEKMSDQSYYYAQWGPGDIKYKDLNDDGKITPGTNTINDHGDLSVIGNSTPKYSYSISGGLNWKNFDFKMFWQGIGKRDFLPNHYSEYFWGLMAAPNNSTILENGVMLDYWRPANETNILGPNTDSYLPKPYFSDQRDKNTQDQSRFLLNAAYLRLKNVQLGYSIPQYVLNRIFIKSARIYVSGENLLTFSPLPKLFEPETTIASNPGDGGVNLGQIYPITKMFSFGVSLTF